MKASSVLTIALSAMCCPGFAVELKTSSADRTDLAALRQTVEQGYAKLDHFTMACFGCTADTKRGKPAESLCFGGMSYGFDRKTRRLAILKQGKPELLIQDRHLFLFLWEGFVDDTTYFEIVKDRSITWDDVDEAEQIVEKQCPLASYDRLDRCMILPLLKGGTDRLFAAAVRILKRKQETESTDVFELGHPQSKIWIGPPQATAKLDPAQYPRCFRSEGGRTKLSFAVDSSGIVSAVVGIAAREDVFGLPGNPVFVVKKNCGFVGKGQQLDEQHEASLDLPAGAKCIGVADLRGACLAANKAEGTEPLQLRLTQLEEEQRNNLKKEKLLQAEIVEARSTRKPADQLTALQADLIEARGRDQTYDYVIPRLRGLIADLERMEPKGNR